VNPAKLPDIKVIRTNFIVNFFAIAFFVTTGVLLVQREYRVWAVEDTIVQLGQQVKEAEAENKSLLELSKQFVQAGKRVAEVELFYLAPFTAPEFLAELAAFRPESTILKSISFQESSPGKAKNKNALSYAIQLSGEVKDLKDLDLFKGRLAEWEFLQLKNYELSVSESMDGRNEATGTFPYTLNISLQPLAK
jgi:hypothetical protein